MFQVFLTLIVILIVSFIIARIMRSYNVFTRLILASSLGFIIGSNCVVKSSQDTSDKSIVTTAISPTLYNFSPAFVWTDDKDNVMSQDSIGDTVVTKENIDVITTNKDEPTLKPEIINDS